MDELLTIAGNVVLAPILIWFMRQNAELIKKLMGMQEKTTAAIGENTEVLRENREALHRNADAVEKVNRVIVNCTRK